MPKADVKQKKHINKDQRFKLVLLDSHAILHRAYHAMPDFTAKKTGEPTGALYGLCAMLLKIVDELKPDYLVACYDLPQPTYRHEAYKDYKSGRAKADEALIGQIKKSREVFEAFNITAYDAPGFEADDILGTIVEDVLKNHTQVDVIIASGDMDTLQLVKSDRVKVYTLKKGINDTILYNEDSVKERFGFGPELLPDYKGLRGDPSDNIIGIQGIGEKTASLLIQKFGSIENIYKVLNSKEGEETFLKAGFKERVIDLLKEGEEEAEFSKMLALIRRDAPINFLLPDKKWKEGFDFKKIENLFSELEFRNLGNRVKSVILGEKSEKLVVPKNPKEIAETKTHKENHNLFGNALATKPVDETLISEDFKKIAIGAWLLDSNYTNPSVENILSITNAGSIKEAEKTVNEEIKRRGLERVYKEIELPLIPIIKKIEEKGIKVDVEYLNKMSLEYSASLKNIEDKIWKEAGEEFNINSPKQTGKILFEKLMLGGRNIRKTAGGAKSTKESELIKMKDEHPIISLILDHRELAKLLSTYIDNIPKLVDANNRLHTSLDQTGTTTGRLSSSEPNLQNIPIKSELGKRIRGAFVAEKQNKLLILDYSQIQLRIAAFLSKDPELLKIFKSGRDVHTETASKIFGVSVEAVDSSMRSKAKTINFGVMYGMGVSALQKNIGTDRKEAQEFYTNYFETFTGLALYLDKTKAEALRKGYTETFFGRRRYFEGLQSMIPYVRAQAERMAINAPIQGTEADIIKMAMIKVDEEIVKRGWDKDVFLILQVHDELLIEVKEGIAKEVGDVLKNVMESVVKPEEISGISLKVDFKICNNWGEK